MKTKTYTVDERGTKYDSYRNCSYFSVCFVLAFLLRMNGVDHAQIKRKLISVSADG